MYFKKLELIGFKSFAEKIMLRFERGITAVVGPNGCGKSNIFDSIRWVLGEQSIKSLRGSKMEDVIFNGTENIPALGFAEVSLTLSNETKILPIDYEEITITRRLYRSGESEYFINNNAVRLKDINELFMGTGIGAESYSLVEQGKIDLVLSSKPEDRRLVFDEATGVSKYKAKKKEALRKLEDTDNNLLRVNDIIQEVKRQISSIERQANKARRYKEIFDKLKGLEINLAKYEIESLLTHCKEFQDMESKIKEKIIQAEVNLEEINKKINLVRNESENLNQENLRLNNELINNKNLVERKNQIIKIDAERVLELNKRLESIQAQNDTLSKRIEQERQELLKIDKSLEEIKHGSLHKQDLVSNKEAKLKETQDLIHRSQERIKQSNSTNFQIASSKTKLNNELIDINSSLNTLVARKHRLETELLKTKEEKESSENELSAKKEQLESLKSILQQKENKANSLKDYLSKIYIEIDATREEINKLNQINISLQSQKEFLEQLKLKYENMPPAKDAQLIIKDIEKIDEKEISGIIAKAKSVSYDKEGKTYHISCEAKLFSLDVRLIDEKIGQIQNQIVEKGDYFEKQKNRAQHSKQELEQLQSDMQKDQIGLADKEAVLKNFQINFQKICDELSLLQFDLKDIADNINRLTERELELKKDMGDLDQKKIDQENILSSSQLEINNANKIRETLLVEITQLKTELESLKIKERDTSTTLSMLKRALFENEHVLSTQQTEKAECMSKSEQLKQESITLENEIVKLKQDSDLLEIQLKAKREEFSQKEHILKELREQEQVQNSLNNENKENLHKQQFKIQENLFKLNQIKERVLQLYHCNIEEIAPSAGLIEFNLEITKQEINQLRQKIDSFGTVNLVAIEELEELKKRYDFLQHQQIDLNTAKESLIEAIRKINRTTRKMFLDTFQQVAREFKNHFRLLFGGGDAELFLIDDENVLESGIEIVCRPPGKKLQNIMLLSGGERALSAIALIFAIFKTKPAPFCVLDEIDAALDEANIDRFSRMLKEFAKISQFIVITHSKKTIVHADVMYGITMEKSGISKIVSVKLSENNKSEDRDKKLSTVENKSALTAVDTN